jgi:hypothetical protein
MNLQRRSRHRLALVLLASAGAVGLALVGCATASPAATQSAPAALEVLTPFTTYHYDTGRSGSVPSLPAATTLRAAWSAGLDGAVYAEPLVVGQLIIVATENDTVYALRADGSIAWHTHLGTAVPRSALPCGNINPSGITSTPVYDPTTHTVDVLAERWAPVQHLFAELDPATGGVVRSRTLDMPGVSPSVEQVRGALTYSFLHVWVPFGGRYGDCGQYHGFLAGVPAKTLAPAVVYRTPSSREAGIWTPPGATIDPVGYPYVAVGNGASTTAYDDSDSVVRLNPLTAQKVDLFAPSTWANDNARDLDLGSTGPTTVGQWIFAVGKRGTGYVARAGGMGGVGHPVWQGQVCASFGGTTRVGYTIYVPCSDGIRAVAVSPTTGQAVVVWHARSTVTGPVLVGAGGVWSVDPTLGRLVELNAGTGVELRSIPIGRVTAHFATPTLSGRFVIVPTLSGVSVFRTN